MAATADTPIAHSRKTIQGQTARMLWLICKHISAEAFRKNRVQGNQGAEKGVMDSGKKVAVCGKFR